MVVMEFVVTCPSCRSETKILGENTNPIIYRCKGCDKGVVIEPRKVYTVSGGYVKRLFNQYRPRACGQLVALRLSDEARKIISSDKLEGLRDLLEQDIDVKDFIKRLG